MINFIKRAISVLFFVAVIFTNMFLIHADFPWAWIPIGIDVGLIIAVFIMGIIMVCTSEPDPSTRFGSLDFGPKPKDKKKKRGKKNASKR